MTSTLPLDYGGYDDGIATRPVALAEALRRHGFRTGAFSTDPYLNAYYGYDRGFDAFVELFDAALLWEHVCRDYVAAYLRWQREGRIDRATLHALVAGRLRRLLPYLEGYASRKLPPGEARLHRPASALYRVPFERRRDRVRQAIAWLEQDEAGLVERVLQSPLVTGTPIPVAGTTRWTERVAAALGAWPEKRRVRFVDAIDVVSCAAGWLERQPGHARWFIWLSLNDVHDGNVSHHWFGRDTRAYQRQIRGAQADARAAIRERLAIAFVDRAIGHLVDILRRQGRLDDTLLVVCSDHGREDHGAPFSSLMSDTVIRVPLLFWRPGLAPAVEAHPCSLLDVAPTVLDWLGLPAEPAFQGLPVGSPAARAREAVVVQQLGGGPCDLDHRRPVVCRISRTEKRAVLPDGSAWRLDLEARPRAWTRVS